MVIVSENGSSSLTRLLKGAAPVLLVLLFLVNTPTEPSSLLVPILLIVLPFFVYDLFFRQPYKRRFARARAARRGILQ